MTPAAQRPVWLTNEIQSAVSPRIAGNRIRWSKTESADGWAADEDVLDLVTGLATGVAAEPREVMWERVRDFFQRRGLIKLCTAHGLPVHHDGGCPSAQTEQNCVRLGHVLRFAAVVASLRRIGLSAMMRRPGERSDWEVLRSWRGLSYAGEDLTDYRVARHWLGEYLTWLHRAAGVGPMVHWTAGRLQVTSIADDLVGHVAILLPRDINSLDDRTYLCDVCGKATVRARAPRPGEGVYCDEDKCQREKFRRNTARSRQHRRERATNEEEAK
jgi:hypothetical protein